MDPDGSNVVRLTNSPAAEGAPAWSPDGSRIAFESATATLRHAEGVFWGKPEICVMDADGSDIVRVTDMAGHKNSAPAWSPDGTRIAFTSDRDGNSEIYVMDADGSNVVRLTRSEAQDFRPAWSPVFR
jgi:Tol biopolymer transport system component